MSSSKRERDGDAAAPAARRTRLTAPPAAPRSPAEKRTPVNPTPATKTPRQPKKSPMTQAKTPRTPLLVDTKAGKKVPAAAADASDASSASPRSPIRADSPTHLASAAIALADGAHPGVGGLRQRGTRTVLEPYRGDGAKPKAFVLRGGGVRDGYDYLVHDVGGGGCGGSQGGAWAVLCRLLGPAPAAALVAVALAAAALMLHFDATRGLVPPAHMTGHPLVFVPGLVDDGVAADLRAFMRSVGAREGGFPTNLRDTSFYKAKRDHVGEAVPSVGGGCGHTHPFLTPTNDGSLCALPGRVDIGRHFIGAGGIDGLKETFEVSG